MRKKQSYYRIKSGVRSGLEDKFKSLLEDMSIPFKYEEDQLKYIVPEKEHKYTPDFFLTDKGFFIETKGRFVSADRQKHLLIKKQHPEVEIRFIFSNPNATLDKRSQTTYGKWCEKNGYAYCSIRDKETIEQWLTS